MDKSSSTFSVLVITMVNYSDNYSYLDCVKCIKIIDNEKEHPWGAMIEYKKEYYKDHTEKSGDLWFIKTQDFSYKATLKISKE